MGYRYIPELLTTHNDSFKSSFPFCTLTLNTQIFSLFSARRTKVIDDESDYFATDSRWLSKKERKILKDKEDKLQQLKHGSRRDKKITLDFAGRNVIEEKATDEMNGKENHTGAELCSVLQSHQNHNVVIKLCYKVIIYFLEIYKSAQEFLESTLSNNNGTNHPRYVAEPPLVSDP